MSKRKAVVRLLGPSVYHETPIGLAKYPVLVEAKICSILNAHAEIAASVIDKIAPLRGDAVRTYPLTWFNPWFEGDDCEKSWEEVDVNPFTAWNNLKSSRDVGAMPAKLEVIR